MTPSVGRVVWYYPEGLDAGPRAATIACVHSRTAVNIGFIDRDGNPGSAQNVVLYDRDEHPPENGAFAKWPDLIL